MSIVSIINTSAGLVIATDGRSTSPSRVEGCAVTFSDLEQKIFPARYKGRDFAWSITGLAGGTSFDLKAEAAKAMAALAADKFVLAEAFTSRVARRINESIRAARADGRLGWFPSHPASDAQNTIAVIFMVGFFRSKTQPWIVSMRFWHDDQTLAEPIVETQTRLNDCVLSGPTEIANKYLQGPDEPMTGKHFRAAGPSIGQGLAFLNGYIEACKDSAAQQLYPICRAVGGHTHAAAVTPDAGFRWLIPPASCPAG